MRWVVHREFRLDEVDARPSTAKRACGTILSERRASHAFFGIFVLVNPVRGFDQGPELTRVGQAVGKEGRPRERGTHKRLRSGKYLNGR